MADRLGTLDTPEPNVGGLLDAIWSVIEQQWLDTTQEVPAYVHELYDHQIRYAPDVEGKIKEYYSGEITWEVLTDYIISRASTEDFFPQYPTTSPYWQLDRSQLSSDILALYILFSWNPAAEWALIELLSRALENLDTARIGDRVVPVPFKEDFDRFLVGMITRQEKMRELHEHYFGESEEGGGDQGGLLGIFEDIGILGAKAAVWGLEVGASIAETLPYLGDLGDDIAEFYRRDVPAIAASILSVPIAVGDLGREYREALTGDPLQTLAGTAAGIAGTVTGAFLFLDLYFYATEPELGWGNWRRDTGSGAFQVGMAMGELGAGIGELFVAGPAAAASLPKLGTLRVPVSVLSASPSGAALGYTIALPLPVVRGLIAEHGLVLQGAYSLFASGRTRPTPEEPEDDKSDIENGDRYDLQKRIAQIEFGEPVPRDVAEFVSDPNLRAIVAENYKQKSAYGTGSTADALRFELQTDNPLKGKWHLKKAIDERRALKTWITRRLNFFLHQMNRRISISKLHGSC